VYFGPLSFLDSRRENTCVYTELHQALAKEG